MLCIYAYITPFFSEMQLLFYILCFVSFSSYAAEGSSGYQGDKRTGAVNILAQRIIPLADWLAGALVNTVEHEPFARDPEEHDRRNSCSKRTDID